MIYNLQDMIDKLTKEGYSEANANAKVCQDIVLKALAESPLSRHVTIKGGVVIKKCLRHINSPSPSFMRGIWGFSFSPFSFITAI